MATTWFVLTGEYPPQPGGISDYTSQVARGLAAVGDDVCVIAPECDVEREVQESNVNVIRLTRGFGLRGLHQIHRLIKDCPQPARILVQYVPHAWGWKGMNVAFCLWLYWYCRHRPWVMFHEVSHPFRLWQPLSHRVLAFANRIMAMLVGRTAERVFVSIPTWTSLLGRLGVNTEKIEWLPVPSGISTEADPLCVADVRQRYLSNGQVSLVGHFGTYAPIVTSLLEQIIPPLLEQQSRCVVLLVGRNAGQFADRLRSLWPAIGNRIVSAENLSADEVAVHLSACDCLVQPYPDGVSGRRTSVMAGLALGLPIVTTSGFLTEPDVWQNSNAVELVSAATPTAAVDAIQSLLEDFPRRKRLGERAKQFYADQFSIEHTLSALRADSENGKGTPHFDYLAKALTVPGVSP